MYREERRIREKVEEEEVLSKPMLNTNAIEEMSQDWRMERVPGRMCIRLPLSVVYLGT